MSRGTIDWISAPTTPLMTDAKSKTKSAQVNLPPAWNRA